MTYTDINQVYNGYQNSPVQKTFNSFQKSTEYWSITPYSAQASLETTELAAGQLRYITLYWSGCFQNTTDEAIVAGTFKGAQISIRSHIIWWGKKSVNNNPVPTIYKGMPWGVANATEEMRNLEIQSDCTENLI